jgi:hypothetical protein
MRIQEDKNEPQKSEEVSFFKSAGCSLWGAGGFSCSLKTLQRGLEKSTVLHF